MKNVDFVVVKKEQEHTYKGGVGYRGPGLKKLGFPVGPYSKAGAKTLVRQMKTVDRKLELVILPYKE